MKYLCLTLCTILIGIKAYSQEIDAVEHRLSKLVVQKNKKKTFLVSDRDSTLLLYVDTLIMKDKSALNFYGIKDATIVAKHAEFGIKTVVSGIGSNNNATNFDINLNIYALGSLFIIAKGQDANNGFTTHPNGNGGNVTVKYNKNTINPQTENRKKKGYLYINTTGGGQNVIPETDIRIIQSQITISPGLRGIPRGLIYSGSSGKNGEVKIENY